MADLDSLMNRKITIFTHDDTEYQGILFNINTKEHSLVLRNVTISKGKGDDRVKQNPEPISFVSFPGNEIKDLFMDDDNEAPAGGAAATVSNDSSQATATTTAAASSASSDAKPAASNTSSNSSENKPKEINRTNSRNKPAPSAAADKADTNTVFDIAHYSQTSQQFNKVEAFADIKKNPVEVAKYNFDDFFDNLGVAADAGKPRQYGGEEKKLNIETFGSAGVSNYSGGRGGYYGRGGRGGGRGNYHNNNNNNFNNNNRGRGHYSNRPQYQSQFANNNRDINGANPRSAGKVGGGNAAAKDTPKPK
jgi:hypothetical protein